MLYWCDGNHEDHEELENRTTDAFWPRTRYMARGKTLELPDGRIVLFMGGALSVDRHLRIQGSGHYGWFDREQTWESDVMDLDIDHVDIVISHTCPLEFKAPSAHTDKYNDCSRAALSYILHEYRPKEWYCGHWHASAKGRYEDCRWEILNRFDKHQRKEEFKYVTL